MRAVRDEGGDRVPVTALAAGAVRVSDRRRREFECGVQSGGIGTGVRAVQP